MHTFSETGAGVPAFLAKLWRLVDDPDTNNLICWSKDGRSFIIQNQAQFARELLPLNYKHNNMASFIRQLNMYGFHKITSIENGGLKFDRDEMEFSHPCFKRNCSYLLEHIKRKIANTKSLDEKAAMKPEAVSKVLQDVKVMRGRQDSLDSRFSVMKQENEALWREIASLRQKHAKQQQIVNKLIQFLITIVQPSRNMAGVKRHMQLMINDTPENAKQRKDSESEMDNQGPVIHELGEELLDEVEDVDLLDANSPYINIASHAAENEPIERPQSSASMHSQHYDYSNQSIEDAMGNIIAAKNLSNNAAEQLHSPATPMMQSVYMDGQQNVYHVTEVPDVQHAADNEHAMPANYIEDHLTTPMVREQMARSQMLKQKNKQRRKQDNTNGNRPAAPTMIASPSTSAAAAAMSLPQKAAKLQRVSKQSNTKAGSPMGNNAAMIGDQEIQIKAEQTDVDPMMYLNVYPDDNVMLSDAPLISPNLSNDSSQQTLSTGGMMLGNTTASPLTANDNSLLMPEDAGNSNLYNANQFIAADMPADLFDDNSLLLNNNAKQQPTQQQRQQQAEQTQQLLGQFAANNGKFSSYVVGNNNNNLSSAASTSMGVTSGGSSNNGSTTTLAKYSRQSEPVSRDEVNGHLDAVQDELDTLKDLLRGDNYSLDANTLLGDNNNNNAAASTATMRNSINLANTMEADWLIKLFNDSDILGPYGLSLPGDNSNDKKGSELMAYQPIYDLSDIMDINNKNDLEDGNVGNANAPSSSRQVRPQSSVLNTPQHQ